MEGFCKKKNSQDGNPFKPQVWVEQVYVWVEFVVGSRHCSQGFSPATKTNTSKFQCDLATVDKRHYRNAPANSHFFYLLQLFF